MKTYFFFFVAMFIFFGMLLIKKDKNLTLSITDIESESSYKYFYTALGEVDIEEINKNVFEKFGYLLVKNALFPVLRKAVPQTCEQVFASWQNNAAKGLTIDPPTVLPNPEAFLLNNYSSLFFAYFNESAQSSNGALKIWSKELIDDMVNKAKNNPDYVPRYYEGESLAVHAATKHYSVKGQTGAVIGSHHPWAEAFVLANGAKHVTNIEYQNTSIVHPQMDFLHAFDLPSSKEKYYDKFDFIVSFSSIEHSGLGRYGDPIDPIGDIREMNKIHCMLKPKGLLFLGFAIGPDSIFYNAHRVYGRIKLAMMFEGFQILNIFKNETIVAEKHLQNVLRKPGHSKQYLFVLEKI